MDEEYSSQDSSLSDPVVPPTQDVYNTSYTSSSSIGEPSTIEPSDKEEDSSNQPQQQQQQRQPIRSAQSERNYYPETSGKKNSNNTSSFPEFEEEDDEEDDEDEEEEQKGDEGGVPEVIEEAGNKPNEKRARQEIAEARRDSKLPPPGTSSSEGEAAAVLKDNKLSSSVAEPPAIMRKQSTPKSSDHDQTVPIEKKTKRVDSRAPAELMGKSSSESSGNLGDVSSNNASSSKASSSTTTLHPASTSSERSSDSKSSGNSSTSLFSSNPTTSTIPQPSVKQSSAGQSASAPSTGSKRPLDPPPPPTPERQTRKRGGPRELLKKRQGGGKFTPDEQLEIDAPTNPFASNLQIGSRVFARWKDRCFYAGRVVDVLGFNGYKIKFWDNAFKQNPGEDVVPIAQLQPGKILMKTSSSDEIEPVEIKKLPNVNDPQEWVKGMFLVYNEATDTDEQVHWEKLMIDVDQAKDFQLDEATIRKPIAGVDGIYQDNIVPSERKRPRFTAKTDRDLAKLAKDADNEGNEDADVVGHDFDDDEYVDDDKHVNQDRSNKQNIASNKKRPSKLTTSSKDRDRDHRKEHKSSSKKHSKDRHSSSSAMTAHHQHLKESSSSSSSKGSHSRVDNKKSSTSSSSSKAAAMVVQSGGKKYLNNGRGGVEEYHLKKKKKKKDKQEKHYYRDRFGVRIPKASEMGRPFFAGYQFALTTANRAASGAGASALNQQANNNNNNNNNGSTDDEEAPMIEFNKKELREAIVKHGGSLLEDFKDELLDFQNYMLPAGVSIETNQLIEWHDECPGLLANQRFMLLSPGLSPVTDPNTISFEDIWSPLIRKMGGKVIQEPPSADNKSNKSGQVIVDVLLSSDAAIPADLVNKIRGQRGIVVSSEWLIQAIITGGLPDPEGHPKYAYDYIGNNDQTSKSQS